MVSHRTLIAAIVVTFHNSKKDIEAIADECDLFINSVYKYCYSGMIPLTRLLSILQSTNKKNDNMN